MSKHITYTFLVLLATLLLASCSTTRRIPDGEYLYTGVKKLDIQVKADSLKLPSGVTSEVKKAINVAPNNSLISPSIRYPFPLGLWVYNNWNPDAKGLKGWLYKKLVREPVLISDVRPEVRVKIIDEILDNNGYFRGSASYELIYGKNPKKAAIVYNVKPGNYYPIDTIEYLPDTMRLYALIDSVAKRDPYLKPGVRYSVDSLSVVRNRIANAVRNKGYYYFRPDFIEYLADSVTRRGKIMLRLDVASNIPRRMLDLYKTGDITVVVNRTHGGGTPDTVKLKRCTLVQMMPSRLRKKVIAENIAFRTGKIFSVRDMDRTQTYLARLGIFKQIEISVKADTAKNQPEPKLNVLVNCTFDSPIEASVEVNVASKSNSYLGPGLIAGVTNKNIFGGGEQLGVNLNANYEWQTGKSRKSGGLFNSFEFGLNANLTIPRLLLPKFIHRSRRELNWTRFSMGGDILNRPRFFRMAQFNIGMNYEWQWSRRVTNIFTPLRFTYTGLMHTTADFDSICAQNRSIALSFRDQCVPKMEYTYIYDITRKRHTLNWTFTLTEAGNIFAGIWELAGAKGEKKLFRTPFSQFVKGQTQLVYGHRFRTDDWLVTRVLVGAAHAYGNSEVIPYGEQFYIGGANSIRAFTVRSLGPGSYRPPQGERYGYYDQTGTFKFEWNIEYRFPIISVLHGAVFLDTGNIWLLRNDPDRPGGQLQMRSFFKDIAVGTGIGLRVDIRMFVIRGDLGIGIHAPYNTGKSGYYNMPSFKNSLAFHLAIGYPF